MSTVKKWYSAAELAEMKLAGLPSSKKGMIDFANREGWLTHKREGRGGGMEYHPPKSIELQILNKTVGTAVAIAKTKVPSVAKPSKTSVAVTKIVDDFDLTDKQRITKQARQRLITFVSSHSGSMESAIAWLNASRTDGTLSLELVYALDNAWDKPRADLTLTRSTYLKWVALNKTRGTVAPLKRAKDMDIKQWHGLAIAMFQRPQKPTFTAVAEAVQKQYENVSYHMITRFFNEKFSAGEQLKGRHLGSALSAHKYYNKRTAVGMVPWQEIHADGWNTHFTAPHPVTGEFVTYEIWHFHDVATRYTCPPGIGLTENFEVIAKGIENCIRFGGVPLIIQTDSTKIIKNSQRMKTNPATALCERVGFEFRHPVKVGNSQANGIPENFNTSLDRESRQLATYQGKSMDTLAFKRVKKLTGDMVKAANAGDMEQRDKFKKEAEKQGKGIVFTSHAEAVAWINATIEKLNNRPHRELPKISDPITGRIRHQTPKECLQEHIDNGWEAVRMTEADLIKDFRAHVQVKVTRETVSPYGGMRYTHDELTHWNGKQVVVAYDIMDWQQVWIKTLDGSLICTAEFATSSGYRAQSSTDYQHEKRALAQIKRRKNQIDTIIERTPSLTGDVIEGQFRKDDGLIAMAMPAIEREAELVPVEHLPLELPEELGSYMDTVMLLYGNAEQDEDDDAPMNEVAAQ